MSERKEKKQEVSEEKKPRNKKTPAELLDAHIAKIDHSVQRIEDWVQRLTKAVNSKKHKLGDEEKAYVLSYMDNVHTTFLQAMTANKTESTRFSLRRK